MGRNKYAWAWTKSWHKIESFFVRTHTFSFCDFTSLSSLCVCKKKKNKHMYVFKRNRLQKQARKCDLIRSFFFLLRNALYFYHILLICVREKPSTWMFEAGWWKKRVKERRIATKIRDAFSVQSNTEIIFLLYFFPLLLFATKWKPAHRFKKGWVLKKKVHETAIKLKVFCVRSMFLHLLLSIRARLYVRMHLCICVYIWKWH